MKSATVRRLRRESGLTLVEMLISIALLGFVLLGIAPLFIASVRSNYSGYEYTSIHNLARDRLEQLMNLPFTDAQLTSGSFPNDLPPTLPDPQTGIPPSTMKNPLARTYTVQNFISTPPRHHGRSLHHDDGRGRHTVPVQAHRRHRFVLDDRGARHRSAHGPRQRVREEHGRRGVQLKP